MALKYGKFEMPREITIDDAVSTPTFARFIAEPFERGVGPTVGNSLRRTMLTCLEAPAIVSFRIEGVKHEFSAEKGIIEDMTQVAINFKGALLRKLTHAEDPTSRDMRVITTDLDITQEELDANRGQVKVTLAYLIQDPLFEAVNPNHLLFTVTQPMRRQVDIRVAIGRGYVQSERHVLPNRLIDEIVLDTAFSPVRVVNYFVENTRVGQDTDFDRLILEVTTDGRLRPSEALAFAAQICTRQLEVFQKMRVFDLQFDEEGGPSDSEHDEMMNKLSLRIDEIELSVRSANCLAGAGISTIAELVSVPERKMLEFRNFGKKSLYEIKSKLSDMGLYLGMDLARYGLTSENMRERLREYQERRRGRKEAMKNEDVKNEENLEEVHETS